MIVRNHSGFKAALRMILLRNWLAVGLILSIEIGSLEIHRLIPSLQAGVFSAAGVAVLAGTVGVFLSFRFNEAYGRWWEARILWGGVVNASRTFARQVVTYIQPDATRGIEGSAIDRIRRELVYGQIAYVNALRCALRGEDPMAAATPFLESSACDEIRDARNVPTQILASQNRRLTQIIGDDVAGQLKLSRFDTTLTELTALQGGVERIKNTAFPDRVIMVSRTLVWAVAILVSLAFIDPIDVLLIFEFVAVLMIVLSFKLVVQLGEELNDPFENRANDTPMTSLCRTIEIDLRQMLGETELPVPTEARHGILM